MFFNRLPIKSFVAGLALLVTVTSCDHRTEPDPATLPDQIVYALNSSNQLLQLNIRSSNTPIATTTITGVDSPNGERIVSIDFRPATGQLYGVSNMSRIFVINTMTAVARPLTTTAFSPAISGNIVSIDFNPTVDRIRLVTNTGQDLRLNPETGAVVATDGNINGVTGAAVAGVAYTNNVAGATTTTLYDIDPATDRLYIQNPPNAGTLIDVGPLGLNITDAVGFDISSTDNTQGLAAVRFNGASELQQINLTTGRLQKLGNLPGTIIGLAIPTSPVAYAIDGGTNNLLIFNPMNPSVVTTKTLTGLQAGETILGMDARPLNGQLFMLGSTSRLYVVGVNATNAWTATQVGMTGSFTLSGTDFGFDFNPTVDRIRVVSNTGQNLRLNPTVMPTESALAATDGTLTFAPSSGTPNVSASAYTNNFAGATTTTLYDIDVRTGGAMLYRQVPPNDGVLVNVGSLGVDVDGVNGFDIGGTTGAAYALLRSAGVTKVYLINLTTGAATAGASIPGSPAPRGFTLGLGF
ncbi:DUF4394 domain-containing protein [Fibrella forsythiae]|uniref:DUF4394 domain-containing protein n=1 Tax=Fibrella forsythiae TaxID=2817061 RepID=A0ABS3JPC8_9BACT|nr:DUF4394 domain-containing protein [Fibrella forsythiae]MBO0951861.1 DUF4394 domain-containing protein [Fibrella forsythiae]